MRWRIERPRTQARTCWEPTLLFAVSSGSTRTMVPSLTSRRSGQREPQLTVQADHTKVEASLVGLLASASFVSCNTGARAAVPPTTADHFMNSRRLALVFSPGIFVE